MILLPIVLITMATGILGIARVFVLLRIVQPNFHSKVRLYRGGGEEVTWEEIIRKRTGSVDEHRQELWEAFGEACAARATAFWTELGDTQHKSPPPGYDMTDFATALDRFEWAIRQEERQEVAEK